MSRAFRLVLLASLLAVATVGCELGYPALEVETACDDGEDDDGDGRTDCYDLDCAPSCVERCDDGIDNDRDGAMDCADADCNPDPACVESGVEACRNGLDDDGDGDRDCDDPGCDGFCSEHTAAECTDGRDNDGDSLTDAADPRCWPVVRVNADRCASVLGGALVAPLDDPERLDEFYVVGAVPLEVRPVTIGPALYLGSETTIGSSRTLAGGWEGTTIDLLVDRDVTLRLVPASIGEGTPGFAARAFLTVAVGPEDVTVATELEEQRVSARTRVGWHLLQLEVVDGVLQGWLSPLPGLGSGDSVALPSIPIADAVFPTARVLLDGPGTVSRLRVVVGDLDPCDGVPVPGPEAVSFGDDGHDVDVARGLGDELCALSVSCSESLTPFARSAVSDDGLAWGGRTRVGDASAVAVAWDDETETYRAILADPADGALHFYESDDCATWSLREPSEPVRVGDAYALGPLTCDELSAAGLGATISYVIDDGRHEVYWMTGTTGSAQLVRAESFDGGDHFEPARLIPPVRAFGPMLRITALGDERVVTHLANPASGELGVRLGVLADGVYEPVPGPAFLPPSGTPQSFDRDAVRAVTLLPSADGSPSAQLLVGALGDYGVPFGRAIRFGTARLTFGSAETD